MKSIPVNNLFKYFGIALLVLPEYCLYLHNETGNLLNKYHHQNINPMKINLIKKNAIRIYSGLLITTVILILQSCGGGTTTQTTESAPAADTNVAIDTKAHSDSKGIGKFSNVKLAAVDPAKAAEGLKIFTTKCATCHKPTEVKFVGPGLKGVTERRTPEWILNMITNPAEMVLKDPVAKKLYAEILTPMANQNISEEDALKIYDYLRQNDGK